MTSGYRNEKINRLVGGSPTSDHCKGRAADVHQPEMSVRDLMRVVVAQKLPFDQMIDEYARWVHLSFRESGKREASERAKNKTEPTKPTPKKEVVDTSWDGRFLALLSTSPNISLACKAAGINRSTAYEHRQRFPDFAAQWDDALESAVELLEAEVWQRARKHSDTLAIFLLKAHKPEKYGDRLAVQWETRDLDAMSDAELEAYERALVTRIRTS